MGFSPNPISGNTVPYQLRILRTYRKGYFMYVEVSDVVTSENLY